MNKWQKIKRAYYYFVMALVVLIGGLAFFDLYWLDKFDISVLVVLSVYGLLARISEIEEGNE